MFIFEFSGVPVPGKYNLDNGQLLVAPAPKWSRSSCKRGQHMGVDNKVPGPGAYFDEIAHRQQQEQALRSNLRSSGVCRGIQYLGKLNDKPISAM